MPLLAAAFFALQGHAVLADTLTTLPFVSSGVAWNGGFGNTTGSTFEATPGSYTIGSATPGIGRGIVKFDLSAWASALPQGETLQTATLRVFHRSTQGSPGAAVLYHSRTDNSATNAASLFQDGSYLATGLGWNPPQVEGTWIEMDVTSLVAADLSQDAPGALSAFRIQQANDLSLTTSSIRYLIDRSQGNPAQPPQLVLATTGNVVPTEPDLFTTTLTSPSGGVAIEITQANLTGQAAYPNRPALYYRVSRNGTLVLDWSPLGITRTDAAFTHGFKLLGQTDQRIDEEYDLLHGKASRFRNLANEKMIQLQNPAGRPLNLNFRAYDDGIAWRYEMPGEGAATVTGELSGYRLPGGARMWIHPREVSYEQPLTAQSVEALTNQRWGYLALAEVQAANTFLLLHESGVYDDYAGSHLSGPNSRVFTLKLPQSIEGNGVGASEPSATLPWATPWRTAIIGGLDQVVRSGLTTHLARPFDASSHPDTSWIKPGISAWSWWSQGTGSPALQREYINSAQEFGWDYILVDANWHNWANAEQEVRDLVTYGAARGVGVHLWYNSGGPVGTHTSNASNGPVDLMLDRTIRRAEMQKLKDWGVAGIKVDYLNGDKQGRFQQYIGILKDAMEFKLMVNFHGSTLPRGWHRTFPNFMTTEAVRGAEHYKFNSSTAPSGIDNVRFALVRNPIGPMDYTPITFASAFSQKGLTYAHQLALGVVFESGIQHFADRADSSTTAGFRPVFSAAPFVKNYLAMLPTDWDETRLLDGHPDTHAVIARRKGDVWHVGAINGTGAARQVDIDLSQLTGVNSRVEVIREGAGPTVFSRTEVLKPATETVTTELAASGGFVAIVTPVSTPYYEFIKSSIPDLRLRSALGDFDGDGIVNLLEYYFGTDPVSPGGKSDSRPRVLPSGNGWSLVHETRPGAVAGSVLYEKSPDLSAGSWQPLDTSGRVVAQDGTVTVPLAASQDRMFFRVRVIE